MRGPRNHEEEVEAMDATFQRGKVIFCYGSG